MKKTRAFTLIELLTVIAITAVLLTLIVLPLFQSFQVLRQGQAFADAQDKGRLLTERIAREVGNAITVRGGTGSVSTTVNGGGPVVLPTSTLVIQVPKKGGGAIETTLPASKMDLVPPAQGDPGNRVNGAYVDPNTGKGDPTLTRAKGDINLTPRPGGTIVRWFIGLNRAVTTDGTLKPVLYNEPYTGLLLARDGSQDNLYVLRRAEIQPYLQSGMVDTRYFKADPSDPSGKTIADLDDPRFFMADGKYSGPDGNPVDDPVGGAAPGKNQRVLNWQNASVIQTEVSRYDMIRIVTTGAPATPTVAYDSSGAPLVLPLIQFLPSRVASAPAEGSVAARPGEAVDGLDMIGPDTYQTQRGLMSNVIVRYYPSGYDPMNAGQMQVAVSNGGTGVSIYNGQSSTDGLDTIHNTPDNFKLFDLQAYEKALAAGNPFPFTTATSTADVYDTTSPSPGRPWSPETSQRQIFTPFRVLTGTGKITTSFPIDQVGYYPQKTGAVLPNLPAVAILSEEPPTGDPSGTLPSGIGAPLSPLTANYDPNLAYNRIFNGDPSATGVAQNPLLQGIAQRFIDLRMVPNADGMYSPLCPLSPATTTNITGFSLMPQMSLPASGTTAVDSGATMNRVRIVPGSEVVYGPDQTTTGGATASGYASQVRYTRVAKNPGPNQYRINYADLPEPTNTSGIVDYSVLGLGLNTAGFDANTYDQNSIISAVIQPRYKAGYIQFDSDPNVPLPKSVYDQAAGVDTRIKVSYRFMFNGPGDTFAVDYDTREVMQILLTIKNYPQSSAPNPQVVTLKSTATVRNALR